MNAVSRSLDVRTEVRKLASSKPVYAAAGAGMLASQTLRELPALIAKWRSEGAAAALPESVTSFQARATGYVHTARVKAVESYDKLADRGKRALNGYPNGSTKSALNGKSSAVKSSTSGDH